MKRAWQKLKTKVKYYFSLDQEIAQLRTDLQTLVNNPPWLPLLNQDRFRLMEKLAEARESKAYKQSFKEKQPLITVRIATYNNSAELLERAIPSVINQTYKNWEIVIVSDYCTDDTLSRIKALNHPKIRFSELSYHYPYPEYQLHRWMAQGLLAHNEAVRLSKGSWIAPLDDDNEFLPYHLEMLLHKAQREQLELVYGNMISIDRETHAIRKVGGFPPQVGNFDYSACLYNKALSIFPFDINSYLYQEVGDTNLIRRLREAGVRMGFVNKYVTKYYFHKPGSPRSTEIFPQQKHVYDIFKEVEKHPGEISISAADSLLETLINSEGSVLILGNENKKLTAFVTEIFKQKLNLPTAKLHRQAAERKYATIINNQKALSPTTSTIISNNLLNSGVIFSLNKVALKNKNHEYHRIDEYLLMKI
jgi:glycosyltransferase involved in cell wall biosynthesis